MTEQPRLPLEHFDSDRHSLATGLLLGLMLKEGIKANPVTDDEGNYTPMIDLVLHVDPIEPIRCRIRVLPPTTD